MEQSTGTAILREGPRGHGGGTVLFESAEQPDIDKINKDFETEIVEFEGEERNIKGELSHFDKKIIKRA